MRPPLMMPRPDEGGGGHELRQGHALGVERHVDPPEADIIFLKHDSGILRQLSNPVCGFSMMEQVRLCAVWSTEDWLGSSMNHIQGCRTV